MAITLDNTLTAGANENIADVKDNITGVARDLTAVYRTVHECSTTLGLDLGAATYMFGLSHNVPNQVPNQVSGGGDLIFRGTTQPIFYFDDADYAITGLTTKMRVRAQISANATAPAITFTTGLYPLTVAGGSDGLVYTAGTVVSGSTVAQATPSASTITQANSGAFTIPSDGAYALACVTNGTIANNAAVQISAQVQLAWAE
jgi:hypothetical protein